MIKRFNSSSTYPQKEVSLNNDTFPSARLMRRYATPQNMKPKKQSNSDDIRDKTARV